MTWERIGLGVLAVALVALVAWNAELRSEVAELSERLARAEAVADAGDASGRRGADAARRAERPGRPKAARRVGAARARPALDEVAVPKPDRTEDTGSAGDPEAVPAPMGPAVADEVRAQARGAIEALGAERGWDPATTEEVVLAVQQFGDDGRSIYADVVQGRITPRQGRREFRASWRSSSERLDELVGPEGKAEVLLAIRDLQQTAP